MKHITGIDRHQAVLFPSTPDEMIPQDSEVRFIDDFVNSLDLDKMGFAQVRTKGEGRPPYHPATLLKLYLYGYLNRYRSSRMLEKESGRNLELIWLLQGLQPDHNTISNFRRDHPKAIRRVFRQTVAMAKDFELIGGILIAGDSTKLRAQNSKKNNFNEKKIQRHLDYIEAKLSEFEKALAEADGDAQQTHAIETKRQKHQLQKLRYQGLQKELQESGQKQISTSDPESRHLMVRNNITEVAYNIQTTVDAQNKLLLDYRVTNENDKQAMLPMCRRAKSILGHGQFTALFDKGYHTGYQIGNCHALGITTLVAIPAAPERQAGHIREYQTEHFEYDPEGDYYLCPEGEKLSTNGRYYEKGINYRVKHYKTKACLSCEARKLCTRSRQGRLIERSEHHESLQRNAAAVAADPELYRQRQALVEHPYGTLKRQWGFDHILTKKGKKRASADVGLMMSAYNLRRLLNLIGMAKLRKSLPEYVNNSYSAIYYIIKAIRGFFCYFSRVHPTFTPPHTCPKRFEPDKNILVYQLVS